MNSIGNVVMIGAPIQQQMVSCPIDSMIRKGVSNRAVIVNVEIQQFPVRTSGQEAGPRSVLDLAVFESNIISAITANWIRCDFCAIENYSFDNPIKACLSTGGGG